MQKDATKLLSGKQRKAFEEAFMKKTYLHGAHIISRGNKWAVKKRGAKRALRLFKHRELAFKYACDFVGGEVVVHNKDGTVLFKETYF